MLFPLILNLVDCPVNGCPAKAKVPGRLREHFIFCHWKSKMTILQEGPKPLQQCDQCVMQARLFKHQQSDKFYKFTEKNLRQRDVDIAAGC